MVGTYPELSVDSPSSVSLAFLQCNRDKLAPQFDGMFYRRRVIVDATRHVGVSDDSVFSDPGPVCYARGGSTLTLADVAFVAGFFTEELLDDPYAFFCEDGVCDIDIGVARSLLTDLNRSLCDEERCETIEELSRVILRRAFIEEPSSLVQKDSEPGSVPSCWANFDPDVVDSLCDTPPFGDCSESESFCRSKSAPLHLPKTRQKRHKRPRWFDGGMRSVTRRDIRPSSAGRLLLTLSGALLLSFLFGSCSSIRSTPPFRVTTIPGYNGSATAGESIWTGYVTTDESVERSLFYLFVETDPSLPLVLWLQGGPGCSGLMAWATESGPYTMLDDGSMIRNPWALTRLANVIYLDSPGGVGYGYDASFDDFIGGSDNRTTADLYVFLQEFLGTLFPSYSKNDFYVMGESYGGIYVPLIAKKIVDMKKKQSVQINLKGIMISNGVMDFANYENSRPWYMVGHGIIAVDQFEAGLEACHHDFHTYANLSACHNWTSTFVNQMIGLNILDMYTDCYPYIGYHSKHTVGEIIEKLGLSVFLNARNDPFVDCINTETSYAYFNSLEALKAFGVVPEFSTYTKKWQMCSDTVEFQHNYVTEYFTTSQFVKELMDDYGVRVMIASGDVDLCVPTLCNEWTLREIVDWDSMTFDKWYTGSKKTKDLQIAGWWRGQEGLLDFATIRGAGHMISTYQPMRSFYLMQRWLDGTFPNQ